jgi:hypothetical protein
MRLGLPGSALQMVASHEQDQIVPLCRFAWVAEFLQIDAP